MENKEESSLDRFGLGHSGFQTVGYGGEVGQGGVFVRGFVDGER